MAVLAPLAAAFFGLKRGRATAAGIFVGWAALAKVTPCVLLGLFVLRREWKALAAGSLTIVVLLAASFPLIGAPGFSLWFGLLTEKLGQTVHIISPENMSLHGFVYRALVKHDSFLGPSVPWVELGPQAAQTIAGVLILAICASTVVWMLRPRKALQTAECLAAAVPVVLLMSPITWTHHCVLLLLPLAVITTTALQRPRLAGSDLVWIVALLLCFVIRPVQRFNLDLPSRLTHLFAPMITYAVVLTWLFMVARFVALKRLAPAKMIRPAQASPASDRRSTAPA